MRLPSANRREDGLEISVDSSDFVFVELLEFFAEFDSALASSAR
jgi:hypothetical protein